MIFDSCSWQEIWFCWVHSSRQPSISGDTGDVYPMFVLRRGSTRHILSLSHAFLQHLRSEINLAADTLDSRMLTCVCVCGRMEPPPSFGSDWLQRFGVQNPDCWFRCSSRQWHSKDVRRWQQRGWAESLDQFWVGFWLEPSPLINHVQ